MLSTSYCNGIYRMSLKRMLLWLLLIVVIGVVAWLTGKNSPL